MASLLPDPAYFASLPKAVLYAAVVLRDEHGHVVMEDPTYRDHWLLPGGGVDPGEDPRTAARRELREELGLDLEVGRLLTVAWSPARITSAAPMALHFLFDAGVVPRAELEARIVPQAEELAGWALVPEADAEILSPWGAARLRQALATLRGEHPADLWAGTAG